jgi:hypothetical protein
MRLEQIQKELGIAQIKLKKRGKTRWNSLAAQLKSILHSMHALVILQDQGALGADNLVIPLLNHKPDFEAIVRVLDIVAVSLRLLEGSTYMTLPHVPFVVHKTLAALSVVPEGEREYARKARVALHDAVKKRLGHHQTDGTLPTVQAALLMPCYASHAADIGISDATSELAFNKSVEWLNLIDPPNVVANAAALPRHLRQRDTGSNADSLRNALADLHGVDAKPLPHMSTDGLKAANAHFCAYWTAKCAGLPAISKMIRMTTSMSASSSCVEQVFSGAGLINSALRTRMHPSTLEQLLVVQRYSRQYGVDKLVVFAENRVDPAGEVDD